MFGRTAPEGFTWTTWQTRWVAAAVIALSMTPARCVREIPARDVSADPRPEGSWPLYGDVLEANSATALDFERLPGVGPRMAERLLAERGEGYCDPREIEEVLGARVWRAVEPMLNVTPSRRCSSSSRG